MVGNILRLMLTRGLSIIRWNNFPRVNDIMQMDNVGMTLHTALFLAYLENKNIDRLYLIKKIIFSSLSDLILSDINSGTKSYIKKEDKKIFEQLLEKSYEYFLHQDAPKIIQEDFLETMGRNDRNFEDQIILAAKKYVGYFEARSNGRVFPDMYDVPLGEMKKELDELAENLQSLALLQSTERYEKYIAHIYRLSYSMRWNQYKRTTPISVMSHKVVVAYCAYVIGMIGNKQGENNDILDMLMRAIYHDVPEVITGDIITPTKKAVPGFIELLEKVEKRMLDDYLFGYIDDAYQKFLHPYILEPFEGEQGKKVKYADIFSALIEAKIEDRAGNTFFYEKYQGILGEISSIDHPGVKFLLQEVLLHFESISDDSSMSSS